MFKIAYQYLQFIPVHRIVWYCYIFNCLLYIFNIKPTDIELNRVLVYINTNSIYQCELGPVPVWIGFKNLST